MAGEDDKNDDGGGFSGFGASSGFGSDGFTGFGGSSGFGANSGQRGQRDYQKLDIKSLELEARQARAQGQLNDDQYKALMSQSRTGNNPNAIQKMIAGNIPLSSIPLAGLDDVQIPIGVQFFDSNWSPAFRVDYAPDIRHEVNNPYSGSALETLFDVLTIGARWSGAIGEAAKQSSEIGGVKNPGGIAGAIIGGGAVGLASKNLPFAVAGAFAGAITGTMLDPAVSTSHLAEAWANRVTAGQSLLDQTHGEMFESDDFGGYSWAVGIAGDIALDPVSYLMPGASAMSKIGGKNSPLIMRTIAEVAPNSNVGRFAKSALDRGAAKIKEVDELTALIAKKTEDFKTLGAEAAVAASDELNKLNDALTAARQAVDSADEIGTVTLSTIGKQFFDEAAAMLAPKFMAEMDDLSRAGSNISDAVMTRSRHEEVADYLVRNFDEVKERVAQATVRRVAAAKTGFMQSAGTALGNLGENLSAAGRPVAGAAAKAVGAPLRVAGKAADAVTNAAGKVADAIPQPVADVARGVFNPIGTARDAIIHGPRTLKKIDRIKATQLDDLFIEGGDILNVERGILNSTKAMRVMAGLDPLIDGLDFKLAFGSDKTLYGRGYVARLFDFFDHGWDAPAEVVHEIRLSNAKIESEIIARSNEVVLGMRKFAPEVREEITRAVEARGWKDVGRAAGDAAVYPQEIEDGIKFVQDQMKAIEDYERANGVFIDSVEGYITHVYKGSTAAKVVLDTARKHGNFATSTANRFSQHRAIATLEEGADLFGEGKMLTDSAQLVAIRWRAAIKSVEKRRLSDWVVRTQGIPYAIVSEQKMGVSKQLLASWFRRHATGEEFMLNVDQVFTSPGSPLHRLGFNQNDHERNIALMRYLMMSPDDAGRFSAEGRALADSIGVNDEARMFVPRNIDGTTRELPKAFRVSLTPHNELAFFDSAPVVGVPGYANGEMDVATAMQAFSGQRMDDFWNSLLTSYSGTRIKDWSPNVRKVLVGLNDYFMENFGVSYVAVVGHTKLADAVSEGIAGAVSRAGRARREGIKGKVKTQAENGRIFAGQQKGARNREQVVRDNNAVIRAAREKIKQARRKQRSDRMNGMLADQKIRPTSDSAYLSEAEYDAYRKAKEAAAKKNQSRTAKMKGLARAAPPTQSFPMPQQDMGWMNDGVLSSSAASTARISPVPDGVNPYTPVTLPIGNASPVVTATGPLGGAASIPLSESGGIGTKVATKEVEKIVDLSTLPDDEAYDLIFNRVNNLITNQLRSGKVRGAEKDSLFNIIDFEPAIPRELVDAANMARSRAGVTSHIIPPTEKEIDEVRAMMIALGFEGRSARALMRSTIGKDVPDTQRELEIVREAIAPFLDDTLRKATPFKGAPSKYDIFNRDSVVVLPMEFSPRVKNNSVPNILDQDFGIPSATNPALEKDLSKIGFDDETLNKVNIGPEGRVIQDPVFGHSDSNNMVSGADDMVVGQTPKGMAANPRGNTPVGTRKVTSPEGYEADVPFSAYPQVEKAAKALKDRLDELDEARGLMAQNEARRVEFWGDANGGGAAGKFYDAVRTRRLAKDNAARTILGKQIGEDNTAFNSQFVTSLNGMIDGNAKYADVVTYIESNIILPRGELLARLHGFDNFADFSKSGEYSIMMDRVLNRATKDGVAVRPVKSSMRPKSVRGRLRAYIYDVHNAAEEAAAKAVFNLDGEEFIGFDEVAGYNRQLTTSRNNIRSLAKKRRDAHSRAMYDHRKALAEAEASAGGIEDVDINLGRADAVRRAEVILSAGEREFAASLKATNQSPELTQKFIRAMDSMSDIELSNTIRTGVATVGEENIYLNGRQIESLKSLVGLKSSYRRAKIARSNKLGETATLRDHENDIVVAKKFVLGLSDDKQASAEAFKVAIETGDEAAIAKVVTLANGKKEDVLQAVRDARKAYHMGFLADRKLAGAQGAAREAFGPNDSGIFEGLKQGDFSPQRVDVLMPQSVAVLVADALGNANQNRSPALQKFLRLYDGVQSMFKTNMLSPWSGYWARNGFSNAMLTSANLFGKMMRDDYSGVAVETADLMTYAIAKETTYFGDNTAKMIEKLGKKQIISDNGRKVSVADFYDRMASEGVLRGHAHSQIVSEGPVQRFGAAGLGAGIGLLGSATGHSLIESAVGDGEQNATSFSIATFMSTAAGAYLGYRKPSGAVRFGDDTKQFLADNKAGLPIYSGLDKVTGYLQTNMRSVVQAGELATDMPFRVANYVNEFKLTGSHLRASDNVFQTLNNWNNLSSSEREIMRRVIPFYGWTKFAIQHTFDQVVRRPQELGTVAKVQEWWNKAYDLNPNEVQDHLHNAVYFASQSTSYKGEGAKRKKVEQITFYSGMGLPVEDAAKVADAVLGNSDMLTLATRGPFAVTTGFEMLFNRDSFTGDPISSPVEVTKAESGRPWDTAPWYIQAAVGYKSRTKDTDSMVDPEFAYALGETPWSRFIHVAKSVYRIDPDDKKAKPDYRTMATALLGPSVYVMDRDTGQYYMNKRRIDIMAEKLEAIGRIRKINKNVDVNKRD